MSRDGLVARSLVSSAILASISLVRSERVRAMPSALERSLDTFPSISWREASADCASKGTLANGIGVGAGVGFAGEAAACSPGAVPALETKTRRTSKTIRSRDSGSKGTESNAKGFSFVDSAEWREDKAGLGRFFAPTGPQNSGGGFNPG